MLFFAIISNQLIKKSQSGSRYGPVWLRIADVGYADHHLKHYIRTQMIRSSLRPQSGHNIPPDPPILPIQALYRLRSGCCKALFDRKLLDYLA